MVVHQIEEFSFAVNCIQLVRQYEMLLSWIHELMWYGLLLRNCLNKTHAKYFSFTLLVKLRELIKW
jgi:hypothetical protein